MYTETCRILLSACSKAIRMEQQHWPRRQQDIARSLRVQAFADRFRAFERRNEAIAARKAA